MIVNGVVNYDNEMYDEQGHDGSIRVFLTLNIIRV